MLSPVGEISDVEVLNPEVEKENIRDKGSRFAIACLGWLLKMPAPCRPASVRAFLH